jgi:hypothetical protein
VFRGDIEIHVRESDWRAHGHDADTRYNGAVLHVVALASGSDSKQEVESNWSNDSSHSTQLAKQIQTNLERLQTSKWLFLSSTHDPAPLQKLLLDVTAVGLERFHAQTPGIALDIEAFGFDQAIWLGVLRALPIGTQNTAGGQQFVRNIQINSSKGSVNPLRLHTWQ